MVGADKLVTFRTLEIEKMGINIWELIERHLDLLIASIISGAGTWIVGSKIRRAKGNMAEADVNSKIQLIYDKFVEDMDSQYNGMKNQVIELREQVTGLNVEIQKLELQVVGWKSKYEELKRLYGDKESGDHIISDGSEDSK